MSTEFKREERYIVFKLSDLGNSLKGDEIRRLAREYEEHRQQLGKPPLECVVVESDWPEYEPTWKAIEARVTGAQAQPTPSVPDIDYLVDTLSEFADHHVEHGHMSFDKWTLRSAVEAMLMHLSATPSVPEGWKLVPTAESRHPGIYKMLSALHVVDNTPGASEWESYAAFLAAAPEAKP